MAIDRLEKYWKEAEALAEEEARLEARDKLRRQTKTIFTSGTGVLGIQDNEKITNTTLGK